MQIKSRKRLIDANYVSNDSKEIKEKCIKIKPN